ncbi:hypothetical protein NT6N_31900 [Oceaniferula spumae]|uniref:Ice-binding protein C-terminal domain-containing protein n=1 Tax=Oceaniferula spumae TaxID=2979115 RepID=A0AAT9FQD9_9BACT
MMKTNLFIRTTTLVTGMTLGVTALTSAATITLNTLSDSELVGLNDGGGATAPVAPGSGWYTGANAGEVRQRLNSNTELRTQWYFRFDITSLAGVPSGDILSATISIPQIGRLNGSAGAGAPLNLFDNNFVWNTSTDQPGWNDGREVPTGSGTLLHSWADAANEYAVATDLSNTNVEGIFSSSSAALMTTVQSWAANPADNEGFLLSLVGAENIGLAFGTPTLVIQTVPEPSSTALLGLGGLALILRRHR